VKETAEINDLITDVREHLLYFKELGVELLDVDKDVADARAAVDSPALTEPRAKTQRDLPDASTNITRPGLIAPPAAKRPSKLSALPSLSNRAPITNGGTRIVSGSSATNETHDENSAEHLGNATTEMKATATSLKDAFFESGSDLPTTNEAIEDIRADIGDCTRCPLYAGRTQIVHSTGNLQADLMFVGEAPGADEDAQGFPFVGRAGQLLTKIIEGIGYRREDVFIGNINRCRPPANRTPTLPEAHTCRPFLLREIAVVQPKVIVVMGNTALHNLLDTKDGITKVRGVFQDYFGVKVMPTFHPAYLLRDPHKKREVWEDMKTVRDYLKTGK
jgi:uracil-DNA glycosylase family 4